MPRQKPATTGEDPANPAQPSFEDTLHDLETLVEAMESGDLPLHELVNYYEKGNVLLKRCESLLGTARERIQMITLRNSGEIGLETNALPHHTPQPPLSPNASPDDTDDDDDIRLF
jgi:exodeoxyribonuclease VII small subunit